jgi:hypothetical protein
MGKSDGLDFETIYMRERGRQINKHKEIKEEGKNIRNLKNFSTYFVDNYIGI